MIRRKKINIIFTIYLKIKKVIERKKIVIDIYPLKDGSNNKYFWKFIQKKLFNALNRLRFIKIRIL